jgi:hypothetical protein
VSAAAAAAAGVLMAMTWSYHLLSLPPSCPRETHSPRPLHWPPRPPARPPARRAPSTNSL